MTKNERRMVLLLTRFLNAVDRAHEEMLLAAELDAAFDGGEFSGPAHVRTFSNTRHRIAQRFGFASADAAGDGGSCDGCAMTLYNKRQTLNLLFAWGYTEGTLPQRHRPESVVSIHPSMRSGSSTRARVTWEGTNGAGHRLYGVEFIE